MKLVRFFGWGIAIYSVMYVLLAGLSLHGYYSSLFTQTTALVVMIILATIAGVSLRKQNVEDILPYSIFWTIEVAALDALLSVPYTGWTLYLSWNVWIGYALVALVPLFGSLHLRRSSEVPNV